MLCDLRSTSDPSTHRCQRCGFTARFTCPPAQVRRTCDVLDLVEIDSRGSSCVHLGAQVGLQTCSGCRGRVRVKEFACHHPCHQRTTMEECRRCVDYQPQRRLDGRPRRMLLRFPHGFGDAVQLTTLLLHLRELHPQWEIDVATCPGTQSLFTGLCHRALVLGSQGDDYDVNRLLYWHEPDACYQDSPSTKAEKCLRDVFRITPREQLCCYHIQPDAEAGARAESYAQSLPGPFVLIHYQGNSARREKNLDERIIRQVCQGVQSLGHAPVILDWEGRSGLIRQPGVFNPGPGDALWRGASHGDAATLAALAAQAMLCIGIDSGPGHVFGATGTPTLLVWTGHHPLHYFGLAENVTHLVPHDHARLLRPEKDTGLRYFTEHYHHRLYRDLRRSLLGAAEERIDPRRRDYLMDGDVWTRRRHRGPDFVIVKDVYLDDCYGVGQLPRRPRYVVDVGAHIGCFALRVHHRYRRAQIVCVEANPANAAALRANVQDLAAVEIAACGYECREMQLFSTVYPGSDNTGGSIVAPAESAQAAGLQQAAHYRLADRTTPTVTLEELMHRHKLPRIDLLKLDCEGSEFDILQHCDLSRIGHIVGEFHDRRRFDRLIRERFQAWQLRILLDDEPGLFWLWEA